MCGPEDDNKNKISATPGVVNMVRRTWMRGPTVANLHNVKTNRYHPILFREAPQPSHTEGDTLIRSKSVGHHTEGFDDREEALDFCKDMAERQGAKLCIGKDFIWDGEGVPAMIVFFGEKDEEVVPLIGG